MPLLQLHATACQVNAIVITIITKNKNLLFKVIMTLNNRFFFRPLSLLSLEISFNDYEGYGFNSSSNRKNIKTNKRELGIHSLLPL